VPKDVIHTDTIRCVLKNELCNCIVLNVLEHVMYDYGQIPT